MKTIKTLLGFVGTLGGFIGAGYYAIRMANETAILMDRYGGFNVPFEEGAKVLFSLGPFFVLCVAVAGFSLRSLQKGK